MTMQPQARCAFHWRFEEVPRRLNRFRSKPRLCQERATSHSRRLSGGCVGRGYDVIGTPISETLKGAGTSAIVYWPIAPVRRASRDRPLQDPKAAVLGVVGFQVPPLPQPAYYAGQEAKLTRLLEKGCSRHSNQVPKSPTNAGGACAGVSLCSLLRPLRA